MGVGERRVRQLRRRVGPRPRRTVGRAVRVPRPHRARLPARSPRTEPLSLRARRAPGDGVRSGRGADVSGAARRVGPAPGPTPPCRSHPGRGTGGAGHVAALVGVLSRLAAPRRTRRPAESAGRRGAGSVPNARRRATPWGGTVETEAAVLWERPGEWSVEPIELDPPKDGEVLVRLAASGMCHSDEHLVTGDMPVPLPDHRRPRGRRCGRGGRSRRERPRPGDHVVFGFIPACGRCPLVRHRAFEPVRRRGHAHGWPADATGPPATTPAVRTSATMVCLGTFAQHTVVNQASCVKILEDIPLDKACLVGCGVTTGWGSAVYAADVRPGDNVAVIGIGGIGAQRRAGRPPGRRRADLRHRSRWSSSATWLPRSAPPTRAVGRGGVRADPAGDLGPHVRQGDLRHGRRPGATDGVDPRPHRQARPGGRHQHPPRGPRPTSR